MKKNIIITIAFFIMFYISTGHAAIKYVNAQYGSAGATGDTPETGAKNTIAAALGTAEITSAAYDTIWFEYSNVVLVEHSIALAKDMINLLGTGAYMPIITAHDTTKDIFSISADRACDTWTIRGIQFGVDTGDATFAKVINFGNNSQSHWIIEKNYIVGNWTYAIETDFDVWNPFTVRNNIIDAKYEKGGGSYALYFGANNSLCQYYIHNNILTGNKVKKGIYFATVTASGNMDVWLYNNAIFNFDVCLELGEGGGGNIDIWIENNNMHDFKTNDTAIISGTPWIYQRNYNFDTTYYCTSDTIGIDTFIPGHWSAATPMSIKSGGTVTVNIGVKADTSNKNDSPAIEFIYKDSNLSSDTIKLLLGFYGISPKISITYPDSGTETSTQEITVNGTTYITSNGDTVEIYVNSTLNTTVIVTSNVWIGTASLNIGSNTITVILYSDDVIVQDTITVIYSIPTPSLLINNNSNTFIFNMKMILARTRKKINGIFKY